MAEQTEQINALEQRIRVFQLDELLPLLGDCSPSR